MDKTELTRRFQERRGDLDIDSHIYLLSPSALNDMGRLEYCGKYVNDKIKDLQSTIFIAILDLILSFSPANLRQNPKNSRLQKTWYLEQFGLKVCNSKLKKEKSASF